MNALGLAEAPKRDQLQREVGRESVSEGLERGGGYLERSGRLCLRFRDAVTRGPNELKSLTCEAVNHVTNRGIGNIPWEERQEGTTRREPRRVAWGGPGFQGT